MPTSAFTGPQDGRIDRAAFFERCFPTANRLRTQVFFGGHAPQG